MIKTNTLRLSSLTDFNIEKYSGLYQITGKNYWYKHEKKQIKQDHLIGHFIASSCFLQAIIMQDIHYVKK